MTARCGFVRSGSFSRLPVWHCPGRSLAEVFGNRNRRPVRFLGIPSIFGTQRVVVVSFSICCQIPVRKNRGVSPIRRCWFRPATSGIRQETGFRIFPMALAAGIRAFVLAVPGSSPVREPRLWICRTVQGQIGSVAGDVLLCVSGRMDAIVDEVDNQISFRGFAWRVLHSCSRWVGVGTDCQTGSLSTD